MGKWIITQEAKEIFDHKGVSLGMQEKLALFYSKQVGKQRVYRRPLNETDKDFSLHIYTTEKKAKIDADYCNEIYGGNYKPELINE